MSDTGNAKRLIWILAAAVLLLTIVITRCSQSTPLPAYDGSTDTSPTVSPTSTPPPGRMYTDESTGLSLFVPDSWTYVIKSGYTTFIHAASGSSIQIQISDYTPYILYVTEDSLRNEIQRAGGELTYFTVLSSTRYACGYHLDDTVFYEITMYDRDTIVRVVYRVGDMYLQRLDNELSHSIASVTWRERNPFPDDFVINYNEFGSFEYAVPVDWTSGIVDSTLYAQDAKTGASMSLSVFESDARYTDVEQEDFVGYMHQTYPNYILQTFANDSRIIYSTGTYSTGTARFIIVQYLMASGTHEYSITFICPYDAYNDNAQTYTDAISYFRLF